MESEQKEETYRGKKIEELKQMDIREFAKYLTSRARRSVLRNFQEIEEFLKKCKKKIEKNKPIKTHKRHLIVVPQMIGMKIGIHNGKTFIFTEITKDMLGHRLGEFSPTRAKVKHGSAGVGATKGTKFKSKK